MPARFFVEKRKDPDYIPNDPMEIEHVDEFLKLMAVLTGDNRYVDIVKLDGKEIVNMCDVATRLENLGIQKGLAAYQQHLREYKGKTTTAALAYKVSWPEEEIYICTVETLAQTAAEHGITKTALVLVGDVINKSGYSKSRLYAEDFSTEFRAAKKS